MLEWTELLHPPLAPRLLIVTSEDLKLALNPLVDYKNKQGIPTLVVSMKMVRSQPGRDDAEKLKGVIFHANRHYDTRYVMLAGDVSHVPTRYRCVSHALGANIDSNYNPTDFYYADLWTFNASTFNFDMATWDGNGDGWYNEQQWENPLHNPDSVSALPIVAVSRVPAANVDQLERYVAKVIAYETEMPIGGGGSVVFVATKDYSPNAPAEVEETAGVVFPGSAFGIPSVQPRVKRYGIGFSAGDHLPTDWTIASSQDVQNVVGKASWLSYFGHGSALSWDTAINTRHLDSLPRSENLTLAFSCGCETGQFAPIIPWNQSSHGEEYRGADGKHHKYSLSADGRSITDAVSGAVSPAGFLFPPTIFRVPPPDGYDLNPPVDGRCFASAWLFKENAGIAYCGESLVLQPQLANEFEKYMLEAYMSGERVLGEIWLQAQNRYYDAHITPSGSDDIHFEPPRVYLSIMTMFGDPTLRLAPPVAVAPAVASPGVGVTHLFLTGADGKVWQKAFSSGAWQNWFSINAPTSGAGSDPTVAALPDGWVHVFVRGRDGNLYQRSCRNGTWQSWYDHGNPGATRLLVSAPAVTAFDSRNMSIFAQAADGSLVEKRLVSGTWNDWATRTPAGMVQGRPAAVHWDDSVFVFFRGRDNQLWQITRKEEIWQGLYPLGGALVSSPTVATWGPGTLFIFARHSDGRIKQRTYATGAWQSWWSLGSLLSADPAVASWGAGSLFVFAVDYRGKLRQRVLQSNQWKTDWDELFTIP